MKIKRRYHVGAKLNDEIPIVFVMETTRWYSKVSLHKAAFNWSFTRIMPDIGDAIAVISIIALETADQARQRHDNKQFPASLLEDTDYINESN